MHILSIFSAIIPELLIVTILYDLLYNLQLITVL